jgi:hypothetical protein
MRVRDESAQQVLVELSWDELILLKAAINETLNAIEEWEFHTRVGATRQQAGALLQQLHEVYGRRPLE